MSSKGWSLSLAGAFFGIGVLFIPSLGAQLEGAEVVPLDTVAWQEIVPGVEFGPVFGDFSKEAHGKLVRFAPELASPPHTHTHEYYGVVISGTVTNPFEGEENPPEMGPGDAWFVPAGAVHVTACVSEEPCLFYTHGDALWDIQLVEEPGEAPGEGG